MGFRLEYSTTARCKPEHVWQKFSKLEEWAWWNPVIGKTRWLQGQPWQKGSRFLFELTRPRRMTFRPVIIESAPPHRVGWVGTAFLFRGEHWHTFESQPDGATLIKTWEDFSGLGPAFFGQGRKQKLIAMYREWLESLKSESEKIAREALARS
jgi:hypothetical protein